MRDALKVSPDYVAAFGRRVAAEAARDLELLSNIEETCGALAFQADMARRAVDAALELARRVHDSKGPVLDLDGEVVRTFASAQDLIANAVRALDRKRGAAIRAPELCADDGVVEAYDEMVAATRDFHDALGELTTAILEHDADLSPAVGKPTSADELIALLHHQ